MAILLSRRYLFSLADVIARFSLLPLKFREVLTVNLFEKSTCENRIMLKYHKNIYIPYFIPGEKLKQIYQNTVSVSASLSLYPLPQKIYMEIVHG